MRFRLYVDESGDQTYDQLDEFHPQLEDLKQNHFPHSHDYPVILHRTDIINRRHVFGVLVDPARNAAWGEAFLEFVGASQIRLFTVVIDKKVHKERYDTSAIHPYHLCLRFLLERYRGYLMFKKARGDVLAESRGKQEDLALKQVYLDIWNHGTYYISAQEFQKVLTSKELKLERKEKNIAGLQLADLLAHPSKQHILNSRGKIVIPSSSFGVLLAQVFQRKYDLIGVKLFD